MRSHSDWRNIAIYTHRAAAGVLSEVAFVAILGQNASTDSKRFCIPIPYLNGMAPHLQPLAEPSPPSGSLTTLAKKYPVLLFFVLTYALGWGMVTPRILSWLGIVRFNVPDWWVATSFYAPAVAGLYMQWLTQRNLRVFRVYESLGRVVLGLVVGAFLVLVCNPSVAALVAERTPLHTLDWRVFFLCPHITFTCRNP